MSQCLLRWGRAFIFASALVCEVTSPVLSQRLSVEGGGGFGMSTTPSHDYVFHGYLSAQVAVSRQLEVGIDLSLDLNGDQVCVTGCTLEFPDIRGVAAPLTLRLSRLSLGAGPGVFYLYNSVVAHGYVGGLAAHADVALVRIGNSMLTASVRPLLVLGGARSEERDRIAIVPVTLGLRW